MNKEGSGNDEPTPTEEGTYTPAYETEQGRDLRQREDRLFVALDKLRKSEPDLSASVDEQWDFAEKAALVRNEAEEIKVLHEKST